MRIAEKLHAPKEANLLEEPNMVPRQDLSIIRLFYAIFLLSHPILRAAANASCSSRCSIVKKYFAENLDQRNLTLDIAH